MAKNETKEGFICDNLKEACSYLTADDKQGIADETNKSIEMVRAVIRGTRGNKEIESLLISKAIQRTREAVNINAQLLIEKSA